MSEATLEIRPGRLLAAAQAATTGLRFLLTDRIGVFALVWLLFAFGLRPILLAAHYGAAGAPFEAVRGVLEPLALGRIAAMAQWSSFVGCLALAAMIHARFAGLAKAEPTARQSFLIAAAYAGLLALAYIVFLWGRQSVLTLMAHDSFIFMDATYRIWHGQIPSVDFPTALGAACLYLPAFGAWIAGGYAGSVEIASALVALGIGLVLAIAGMKRFPPLMSALLIAVVFFIAVPAALMEDWGGDSATMVNGQSAVLADNLTWAMFYNRWGWSGLIAVFAFLSPRKDGRASLLDIGAMAAVLVFLFYLKLTYFVVGLGAAGVFAALNPRPIRTLAIGGAATLGLVLAIGLLTGSLTSYLANVAQAASVSGDRNTLIPIIRKNLLEITLSCAPVGLAAAVGKLTWRDWLACGYMMAGSLFVIDQNAQLHAICSLICLSAYGVVRLRLETEGRMPRLAAACAFLLLAASPVLERGMILKDAADAARREEVRTPSIWAGVPALKGIFIPERENALAALETASDVQQRRKDLVLIGSMGRRQDLRQGEYLAILMAGLEDLKAVMRPGDSVAVLDMSNPLEFMAGARPARGAWLTLHGDRTVNETVHPAPAGMFGDADHVMIARISMVQPTADLMQALYGDWLAAHYQEKAESAYWIRYSFRKPIG